MDAYLSKPIKAETLAAMVARWVSTLSPDESPPATVAGDAGLLDAALIAGLRELGADEFDALVRLFLTDGAGRIAELRQAGTVGDLAAVVRLAHSLKGSSGTFGAHTLALRCGELQAAAESGDIAAATRLVDLIDAEFVPVTTALRSELAGVASGSPATTP